jgi:hypothetical protein
MTKTLLLAVFGLTALIVNPFFGCDATVEGTFHYSAAEMRAAVEGTWKLRVQGKPEVTLTIKQAADAEQHAARASLVRSASACSQRSFVRTAGACMDESDMPLEIKVAGKPTKRATGILRVLGFEFRAGELTLHLGDRDIYATIKPNGTAESVNDGERQVVTLIRVR